mgnify:CR=1 FL=1
MSGFLRKYISIALFMLLTAGVLSAQEAVFETSGYRCVVREDGTIASLTYPSFGVDFFSAGQKVGPSFYINDGQETLVATWTGTGELEYSASIDDVAARLKYHRDPSFLTFEISIRNNRAEVFAPVKAGIALGLDTYMDQYPHWLTKFFPTLLMNEKTHFYGYFQSPQGQVLGIASPDPIASWSVDYNLSYYDIPPHWFYGHRIESVNLDLINTLPLPEHNPQDMWKLEPGEEKTWKVSLVPVTSLGSFEQEMAEATGLPMISMDRTSYMPGETAAFTVFAASTPEIVMDASFEVAEIAKGQWLVQALLRKTGRYDVTVTAGGYQSSAVILVNDSWAEVIKDARQAALDNHQKPSSHVESWYGFHSAFLAARHFPDTEIDTQLDDRFDLIYNKVFDAENAVPRLYEDRIQNTSSTIGMLVDRYEAFGRIEDLEQAASLADWLIADNQDKGGAYMNGNVKYTSVIYVAKSIMELYLAERDLKEEVWQDRAARHYESVKRAIDELVASQGDFQTEGEMTFEDGMISCSALQVGMFALLQEDPASRQHYAQAMMDILESHDCLTQLKVNDGRRRGGTMRFWEAQYDVLMLPNMFNSPHGWSAWRAYASYYAYLLTLDERYLKETFNAAGAFAGLIERETGKLRWAFVVDPYLRVRQIAAPVEGLTFDDVTTGNPHPDFYGSREFTIGEQYVDMISSWQPVNSQDNDVHEVFKFIEEAVLTNAYIVEREDGTVVGYNCSVEKRGRRLIVLPAEKQIVNLHMNLKSKYKVAFKKL